MAAHRKLDTVGNAIAGNQRRLHALVPHGDPVRDGDGVEPPRHPARLVHPNPRRIRLRIQCGVARCRVIPRRGNPHERPPDFLLGQPHGVIITAMRRPLRPHRNMTAGQLGLVESCHFWASLANNLALTQRGDGVKGGVSKRASGRQGPVPAYRRLVFSSYSPRRTFAMQSANMCVQRATPSFVSNPSLRTSMPR